MKLAFITTMSSASWGGSEALWAATALRALEEHHEVLVSVYDWGDTPAQLSDLKHRGAQIHRRRASKRWRRSKILNRLIDPFKAVVDFAPDVVLINQGGTYDIARGAEMRALRNHVASRRRWPYILLCQCEQPPPARARSLVRAREAFAAAAIVGMLANNLRARSERELGTPLSNVRLFQNSLNVERFGVMAWPRGETLRMAAVGRLEAIKGVDVLLAALGSPPWRDRDWSLDIYGDGIDRSTLEDQAATLELHDKVRFLGFVRDVETVWRDHHVFLNAAEREGVPNSMLEAMLSGRAVVVTNVGGVQEWVREGESGFLAERHDVASMNAALEHMWQNRANLRQLGRLAHDQTLASRDADPAATLLSWLKEVAR